MFNIVMQEYASVFRHLDKDLKSDIDITNMILSIPKMKLKS